MGPDRRGARSRAWVTRRDFLNFALGGAPRAAPWSARASLIGTRTGVLARLWAVSLALAACGPSGPNSGAAPPPAAPSAAGAAAPSSPAAPAPAATPRADQVTSGNLDARAPMAGGDPGGTAITISYATAALADWPFYAAIDQGFFREQRLAVQMIQMAANSAVTALAKGDIDFADSTTPIIIGASRDLPVRVIFAAWDKSPWTVMGKPQYRSLADLRGKIITDNQAGSTGDYYLNAALRRAGLTPADLTIVHNANTEATYTILMSGNVDAAVLAPPHDAQAEQGGYHEITYLGDDLDLPYGGLATNLDTLTARRPVAVATVRALIDAVRWLKSNPDGAADLLERYTGTSREIARRTAEKQAPRLSDRYEFTADSIRQTLAQQAETTGEAIDLPPDQAVDYAPLREAMGQR
jgi:ABC-type nitrate/sulfonate/bicarbonate transport system substrate-binding protein